MHVPFCRSRCHYCDFASHPLKGPAEVDLFLEGLTASLAALPQAGEAPTIYVGGGTPSVLPLAAFTRLLELLAPHLAPGGEWTLEANPESLDEERCRLLAAAGVTRVSLGIQSLDEATLELLGRAHDPQQARHALALAADTAGVEVGADLLLGLPGQEEEQVTALVDELILLGANHLSFYLLTLEEDTHLTQQVAAGQVELPGLERQAALLRHCRHHLGERGLEPYEISNAARPGAECRHNLRYWQGGDYRGLGPAAAGLWQGERTTNLADLETWAGAIKAGLPPVATRERLAPDRAAGERAWLMLRTSLGLDLERVGELTGCSDAWLAGARKVVMQLVAGGVLEQGRSGPRLTEAGVLQADGVGARFLALGDATP